MDGYSHITFMSLHKMDADEYFGMFIDKIENDIRNLYVDEKENKYKELFRFYFLIKALDKLKFVDCSIMNFFIIIYIRS